MGKALSPSYGLIHHRNISDSKPKLTKIYFQRSSIGIRFGNNVKVKPELFRRSDSST